MTEWARYLPCSSPGVFYIRVLEPWLTMPLGEERAEKGGQRHGAPTLFRGLKEEVRRRAERALPCPFLLHLRGAAAGQTRGSRTKHSGACDSGSLTSRESPKAPSRAWGTWDPQGYSPCPSVPGILRSPRLQVWLPRPSLRAASRGTLKPESQGNGREGLGPRLLKHWEAQRSRWTLKKLGVCGVGQGNLSNRHSGGRPKIKILVLPFFFQTRIS